MGSQFTPYLNFAGTCREAMEFYAGVFGGDLRVMTFGEFGMEGPGSEGVMHARLDTPAGYLIMASDLPPGMPEPGAGGNVYLSLSGDDEEELRRYWDALAEGGTVNMPLDKQVWGDVYGDLVDRFGMKWMVNIGQPQ